MNIRNSYTILDGLSGNRLIKIPVKITLFLIYALTLFYLSFYEITWLDHTIPIEILFGGYREMPADSVASVVSFLFIIMYLHQLHFISCYAERIFNSTTNQILFLSSLADVKFYVSYFIWRSVLLLKMNILYLIPIILLYLIRDGVFVYTFISNVYIIFASSILLAALFDIIYYVTKRIHVSEFIALSSLLLFLFLSYLLEIFIFDLNLSNQLIEYIHFIPDVLSMPYQYALMSLSAIYSQSKLFYPLFTLFLLLILSVYLNRNLITRLVK